MQVKGLSGVKAISAGGGHSLALKTDGTVRSWCRNDWRELGNKGEPRDPTRPGEVKYLSGVLAIDAGSSHNLALKTDLTVADWGSNDNGQLGAGVAYTMRDYPGPVVDQQGGVLHRVKAIDAGLWLSLAMVEKPIGPAPGEEPSPDEEPKPELPTCIEVCW